MTLLILAVDDEPDVKELFRQQFRREIRAGKFTMEGRRALSNERWLYWRARR